MASILAVVHGLALIALLVGSLAVTALARRLGASPPLVLVLVGLAVSFAPGVPDYRLDPELVLLLVLPPLLYSAALDSSVLSIRANVRPIGSLAVGLVLFNTAVVGLAAHALVPGLPLASAFVLGAVVAPPDAVAAVAVGRRLGLPRRVMTVLGGESRINDATALTAYRVAVAAALGTGMSVIEGVGVFVLAAFGGVAVGLVIGWCVHRIRLWLADSTMESAVGLVVPFATFLLAEELHASGVLAVVVAGLYLGHRAPEGGFATRLQDRAVWHAADTVLEAVVFGLIGLQLRSVVAEAEGHVVSLTAAGAVLILVLVLARAVWVFSTAYIRGALFPSVRRREQAVPWQYPAVVSWAGMRGVVSLAAAYGLPHDFPGRPTVLYLAFCVTVGTLLLHGLTLPWVIRRLGVRGQEQYADALAEAAAQHAAAQAAVSTLDELADPGTPEHVSKRLRGWAEHRSLGAWERLGRSSEEIGEPPTATFRRLRRAMLAAERETFVRYRDEGRIDDEVLRRVLRELDLEEALLSRD
jgi:monovalent cation/hydrogen antiporter